MLLLLDGFEQLLDAASLLAELLASCPQLKLLVTSRAALEVAGEHEFRVPPLALPPAAEDQPDPQVVSRFPVVCLFVQRAEAVEQDFASRHSAPAQSRRSAVAWMDCRWRSSWRPPGSGCSCLRRCLRGWAAGSSC